MFVFSFTCMIQHRNWPLRSTILNAHGTHASPDGLCTRTHTNEAFSCWFCCKSFRVDRARRGNLCLPGPFLKSFDSCIYIHEPYPWALSVVARRYIEVASSRPGAVDCTVRKERHRTRLACLRPGAGLTGT